MDGVPETVENWIGLDYEVEWRNVRKVTPDEIVGNSIITGTVGNTMSEEVGAFIADNTTEDFFITAEQTDRDDTWGDMAIPFESETKAEEFAELVRKYNGNLRLSSGDYNGWFCYEAE